VLLLHSQGYSAPASEAGSLGVPHPELQVDEEAMNWLSRTLRVCRRAEVFASERILAALNALGRFGACLSVPYARSRPATARCGAEILRSLSDRFCSPLQTCPTRMA